jgi:PAS domain S-box-containing protein
MSIKDLLNSSNSLFQISLINKKGEIIPVEINGRSANFNGKPAHVTSFLDISSRLETESKINLLSTAVEQSAHSVIITDDRGIIEYTNPKFSEITLYQAEEIIGKSVSILESGYHDKSFYKDLWNCLYEGETWKGEFLNKDKQGRPFWASSTITPIKDKNGKITNFLSVMEDISLQKKNREEIEKLNSRLKLAVEAAQFSFWEYKLDTKEAVGDDIIYDFFEIPRNSDIKLFDYFKSLFEKKSWEQLKNNVLFGLEQKNVIELETNININKKNKTLKSYILRGFETLPKDNSIIGLTYDITEQKKFESELIEERKRAEESDQLKSAFLANMSHEIRTPLNGIIGFTSLMEDDFSEFSKEEIQRYLKIISENGSYLLSLVNDIIDLSKIESGQLLIINQKFQLGEIIKKLENRFKTDNNKEVALLFDQTHLNVSLYTDATRLTQILTNLIGNALKFTSEGRVQVSQKITGRYLEMQIVDTGCGIKEEAKSIIFNRFAQGQPLKDQLLGGTGLGLSITKGLVKLLGGDIGFTSEEGKGSVFYFKVLIKNS